MMGSFAIGKMFQGRPRCTKNAVLMMKSCSVAPKILPRKLHPAILIWLLFKSKLLGAVTFMRVVLLSCLVCLRRKGKCGVCCERAH